MITARRTEGTARYPAQQALRSCARAALLAAVCLTARPAGAQTLPFAVTIVDWKAETFESQRRAYRAEARKHEVLFCVDEWRTLDEAGGVRRIVIERTRRVRNGALHTIGGVGQACLDERGEALPIIHTHMNGNCQLSPADLLMTAARGAPFDGVQCGEDHFVWAYAWQIKAIANWVYTSAASERP